MLAFFQRHANLLTLLPFLLLGLALGHLAGTGAGLLLQPSTATVDLSRPVPDPARAQRPTGDTAAILERNIFDSSGPARALEPETPAVERAAAPVQRVNLELVGTVTAGSASLAVINAAGTIERYRLGDEVPGGGTVQEISRNTVRIEYPGGRTEVLTLLEEGPKAADGPPAAVRAAVERSERSRGAAAPANSLAEKVRSAGDNRWIIERSAVAEARNNMNQLLQQARMEPYMVDGETRGFQVKWIQRNSLLSLLGLRPGDVVVEVNRVELDSPEKALMIFQQLREARTLSVGLLRNGERQVFQYEFQ